MIRGMFEPKVVRSMQLLVSAIEEHKPIAVYAMFSGGHDSLTATHIASKLKEFTAAVHINTGFGIEETRRFVRATCADLSWPLKEYRATDCGQDYRETARRYGFPGPAQHFRMYSRLKERPLRVCIRETKRTRRDRVLLVTGIRADESTRRMGYDYPIRREGSCVWASPITDWTKSDCNDYIEANGLKRNEVVDLLHMSGECLCGAFAKAGEKREIETWFPDMGRQIRELESEVSEAGFSWGWGEKPPHTKHKADDPAQMKIPGMLCRGCPTRLPLQGGAK